MKQIPSSFYNIALRASIAAGQKIMEIYSSADFGIEHKADSSPLTLADKAAHLEIVNHLQQTQLPILSEEGKDIPYTGRKDWEYFWMVDPLDGTKEFIKRNGDFTVNIALIHRNSPVWGTIYVPVHQELYWGGTQTGSFKLGGVAAPQEDFLQDALQLPQQAKADRPYTIMASLSHMNEDTQQVVDQKKEKYPDLILNNRGSSLKICAIAEGTADLYPRFAPTMEWDTAAGHAIAKGAGANLFQTNGEELVYNKQNLLNPYFIAEGL